MYKYTIDTGGNAPHADEDILLVIQVMIVKPIQVITVLQLLPLIYRGKYIKVG